MHKIRLTAAAAALASVLALAGCGTTQNAQQSAEAQNADAQGAAPAAEQPAAAAAAPAAQGAAPQSGAAASQPAPGSAGELCLAVNPNLNSDKLAQAVRFGLESRGYTVRELRGDQIKPDACKRIIHYNLVVSADHKKIEGIRYTEVLDGKAHFSAGGRADAKGLTYGMVAGYAANFLDHVKAGK
jgi:pyruvate/2-oxoglutarate dehydrogenase complex dihydrolipoamide acyltransferase (E2) component